MLNIPVGGAICMCMVFVVFGFTVSNVIFNAFRSDGRSFHVDAVEKILGMVDLKDPRIKSIELTYDKLNMTYIDSGSEDVKPEK